MGSLGAGLNVGLSALYAARRGLDVTGHNIANVGTEGYTRQRVTQAGIGAPAVPAFFSKSDGVGSGVATGDTTRLSEAFLDQRALISRGDLAQLEVGATTYRRMEETFNEPGEAGFQSQLDAMWASWDDVANRPGDLAARSQVLERADALVDGVRRASFDLEQQRLSSAEQLQAKVSEVMSLADAVAELNLAIRVGNLSGATPNDLADQRDELVRKLGDAIGATSKDAGNGVVDVYVGGVALVRGEVTTPLELDLTATSATVRWTNGGTPADVRAGTIGGLLRAVNTTIPAYADELDGMAAALVSTVNAMHAAGFDLAGAGGLPFFTATAGSEAATIAVNPALQGNPQLLAASSTSGAGNLDGRNAGRLADGGLGATSPDARYRAMVNRLGIDGQSTGRQLLVQQRIDEQAAAARQSASGVNLDEEMANMLVYQHAYEAAARYISMVDSTLDSLMGILR